MDSSGTVTPFYGFDPDADCIKLHSAIDGFQQQDLKTVTAVICYRSNSQRQTLKEKYMAIYNKDLEKELEDKLKGGFRNAILGLMVPTEDYAAYCVKTSLGFPNSDQTLIEIIASSTNEEIRQMKQSFKKLYNQDLEEEVASETSGTFEQMLLCLLKGNRDMNGSVDPDKVKTDAEDLFEAGEDQFGTDNDVFVEVFSNRSYVHLCAVYEEYENVSEGSTIEEALHNEMRGNAEDLFLAIVEVSRSQIGFFASCLHKSKPILMKSSPPYTIIARSEEDLVQIKEAYLSRYKTSLYSALREQGGRGYCWCLQAICRD